MKVRRILMEALPTLMFVTVITVFAGFLLNSAFYMGDVVGILIITPAIIGTGGDIGTSFGARITTQLHSGLIEPRFRRFRLVYINFFALFLCGFIVSVVIGFAGYSVGALIDGFNFTTPLGLSLLDYLIIALAAGSIEYILILFISLFIAFISFRRGLDPDNLVAPLVTTIADLIGITVIFLTLNLIV
ncbi:MAG: magnesium transporter [Candidatus Helarchaeota archaeon]|nr:magnesium transporter [Candidatus Helarchaeota archaeon]